MIYRGAVDRSLTVDECRWINELERSDVDKCRWINELECSDVRDG